ncbi:STE3-like pheromone receptor [Mycena leptocephala]|nr:STE3-like pheromone receptor [Mycena leptocephala]
MDPALQFALLVASKLIVGIAVAIPAASLCINCRVYKIASCSSVSVSKAEKRRAVLNSRDDIIQNIVPPTPLLPLTTSLTSACYVALTLRAFLHRRAQLAQFLSSSITLTANRYFCLMALAFNTPFST